MRRMFLFLACATAIAHAEAPAGTPIHVMLLKDISSATSHIGEVVPLVVTQDVYFNGRVTIPEGTMAFAKITQCRREGALSAHVFDKPARLCIGLEHLRDIDGKEVRLVPKPNKPGDLQITREMTVKTNAKQSKELESAWESSSTHPVMQKIHGLFSDAAVSLSIDEAQILIQHNVEIPAVQQAIKSGVFGGVISILRDLKSGHWLEAALYISPTTRPALIVIHALQELGRLSGGIGNYIEGRFKGRNIRCEAGVELTVYSG